MPQLLDPITVGVLRLRNRIMRSATAEFVADRATGAPTARMREIYRALGEGGVGLIVTGHACVEYRGRAHGHMAAMASDDLVPAWRGVIRPAQETGARVMMQLNHGGANVNPKVTPDPLSPSGVATNDLASPRPMTEMEILRVVRAFGEAARRAREAGFDGVQIHGAHGYLVTQFLSPATNRRDDRWGGDARRRREFLRAVAGEIHCQVGEDYPVWIKLGVAGKRESGLTIAEGAAVAAACASYGIECVEISHALGVPADLDTRAEARYLPLAEAVREAVGSDFPLALVSGFSSLSVMNEVLASGVVQIVSLCRPLIAEPDLPKKLREGLSDVAVCQRCDRCRPDVPGEGIACHNPQVAKALR